MLLVSFIILCLFLEVTTSQRALEDTRDAPEEEVDMHNFLLENDKRPVINDPTLYPEETAQYWTNQAQERVKQHITRKPITGVAKNVILFLGDGMSISTIAAARIYLGQKHGESGEEATLSFEELPYSGLSKTYCVDSQVPDSACTATAYLTGVKGNKGTVGVTAAVGLMDCESMQNKENHVSSIAHWSQLEGKRTGVVTTTRVTHASPAGIYAHTAHRAWECDADVSHSDQDPRKCTDIAVQLLEGETGKNLNVILGGGRGKFIPKTQTDEEGNKGYRKDRRNLIEEWKRQKSGHNHEYVSNRTALLKVRPTTQYLLGLFTRSHTKYNVDRDPTHQPSLAEMTEAAIKVLSKEKKGYFLFVEGGLIDRAHHSSKARKALNETVEFHKAVQVALNMTNVDDTLIVVTSDHSHTMTVNGYPKRGKDILGIGGTGKDKLPYTTISYANGPGYKKEKDGKRHDVSKDDLSDPEYKYPALVPLGTETHAGEDVGIFARGPWAHLFTGVMEQNVIPHLMAYASCVGDGVTVCNELKKNKE